MDGWLRRACCRRRGAGAWRWRRGAFGETCERDEKVRSTEVLVLTILRPAHTICCSGCAVRSAATAGRCTFVRRRITRLQSYKSRIGGRVQELDSGQQLRTSFAARIARELRRVCADFLQPAPATCHALRQPRKYKVLAVNPRVDPSGPCAKLPTSVAFPCSSPLEIARGPVDKSTGERMAADCSGFTGTSKASSKKNGKVFEILKKKNKIKMGTKRWRILSHKFEMKGARRAC